MRQTLLNIKLMELQQQFCQLTNQLALDQQTDKHEQLCHDFRLLADEYLRKEKSLNEKAQTSHSAAACALSAIQESYCQQCDKLLKQAASACLSDEKNAEMMALYAEFALDYAVLAMDHARLAALKAIDMQMTIEEKEEVIK